VSKKESRKPTKRRLAPLEFRLPVVKKVQPGVQGKEGGEYDGATNQPSKEAPVGSTPRKPQRGVYGWGETKKCVS